MMIEGDIFSDRLRVVQARIHGAAHQCGRDPAEVVLMAVTKTHGPGAVEAAAARGLVHIGENRVQEAITKQAGVAATVFWELIGPLQSNKARQAAVHFNRIQTLDRLKIAQALDRACAEAGRAILPVLLQVNVARDPGKAGVSPEEAPALAEAIVATQHLQLDGLMTIPSLTADPEITRRAFADLRLCSEALRTATGLPLPVLSMGMTADLEIAISEGSTLIRVGTALFGERPYSGEGA